MVKKAIGKAPQPAPSDARVAVDVSTSKNHNSVASARKLSLLEFWNTLWSNAIPLTDPRPETLVDLRHREEILWLLERRLEDIDRCKKDHWLFAYTTLAALAALCFLLISQPDWMQPIFGWVAVVIVVLLWTLWAAMHAATTSAMRNARASKTMSYRLLGNHLTDALGNSDGVKYVPVLIAIAVTSAAAITLSAGAAVGGRWLEKPPIQAIAACKIAATNYVDSALFRV